jgi:hypothetical protein
VRRSYRSIKNEKTDGTALQGIKTVQCSAGQDVGGDSGRHDKAGCGSPYCCFVLSNPSVYSQSSADVISAFNLSFSTAVEINGEGEKA